MTFFSVAHTPTTRRKSDIVSHFSLAMIIISVEQITTTTHAHERKNKQRIWSVNTVLVITKNNADITHQSRLFISPISWPMEILNSFKVKSKVNSGWANQNENIITHRLEKANHRCLISYSKWHHRPEKMFTNLFPSKMFEIFSSFAVRNDDYPPRDVHIFFFYFLGFFFTFLMNFFFHRKS